MTRNLIKNVEVVWSGEWPNLCHGKWQLIIDGKDCTSMIPTEMRYFHMNTYGVYSRWSFGEDYSEEWENYEDGMKSQQWVIANKSWLDHISKDYSDQKKIFEAFQASDWRHGSCGGCI